MDAVFAFHNKRLTHLKLLWHDGTGYRLMFKRLDRGRGQFRIPGPASPGARHVGVSARELDTILKGIDMRLIRAAYRSVSSV